MEILPVVDLKGELIGPEPTGVDFLGGKFTVFSNESRAPRKQTGKKMRGKMAKVHINGKGMTKS